MAKLKPLAFFKEIFKKINRKSKAHKILYLHIKLKTFKIKSLLKLYKIFSKMKLYEIICSFNYYIPQEEYNKEDYLF